MSKSKAKGSKTGDGINDPIELSNIPNFIWSLSDVLRGDFRESEYMLVILPWLLLRRLECLEPSVYGLTALAQAEGDLRQNVLALMQPVRQRLGEAMDIFDVEKTIERLHKAKLLSGMIQKFARLDLGDHVSSAQMGNLFEELLRRYALGSGDSAGEFYTPRDVVRLMAQLLVAQCRVQRKSGMEWHSSVNKGCGDVSEATRRPLMSIWLVWLTSQIDISRGVRSLKMCRTSIC